MKEKLKKAIHKSLSLLLAAAMLLTLSGIPVLAEETTGQEVDTQKIVPENPVHHCVTEDTTDWSYVYFGSYPQTEVTGDALTDAIINAEYENGDAEVDGIKYRRISKEDTNYDGNFGSSDYRYFKWECIKWRVLQNDGETLFVVADKGLDCKGYHETYESVTWENCTLRKWLNQGFYSTAFSSQEQEDIVKQNVVNDNNLVQGTEGGNDTTDHIFLLSIEEVTNPEYGFCEYDSNGSASRWMQASDYAHVMGAFTYSGSNTGGNANCRWWLRSPGDGTSYASYVNYYGYADGDGWDVDDDISACVPALHIDLASALLSSADDGSGEDEENGGTGNIANPVHHCEKEDATNWSYVYFGSYPQTEVIAGGALAAAITEADYDENGDAEVGGIKYRRISKEDTNDDGYFGGRDYRYFKWERIKWRVLQKDDKSLFVVADKGLDCKDYHETYESVTWENCTLHNWLNREFYNTAFSSAEQEAIVEKTVVNEDNPHYGTDGGNDTTDRIFLLSIGEATNPEYGFCKEYSTYSASRWMQVSDYAHAMGAFTYSSSNIGGNANCWWWLRSPGDDTYSASDIGPSGYINRVGNYVDDSEYACVPALYIDLSSDLWSLVDDESNEDDQADLGTKDPTDPGMKDPTDPGTEDPTDPGTKDPTDPGTKDPTDPSANTNTNVKASLAKAIITLSADNYNYDGKAKEPTVKLVTLNGKTLKFGTDYTVSYTNNKNIGTATVTIAGKGNYTDTAKKTFKITAKKGSSFTVDAYKYKITGSSAVAFIGLKSSKTKKVTIQATVKIGGKSFKVTSVAASALKGKKATSVTVGSNVTFIGKNAFASCGKLGMVTIKSTKIKTVGKNAFKGIKATAKIKVPAKKLAAYKKLLKSKGQGSKVKITK